MNKIFDRRRLWIFLAIMGPGLITSLVDNDAGGIATYSIAGAHYGYALLWCLLPITLVLVIVQEMGARMGAVTGKGLSDLIRENFGIKWTLFAMLILLIANLSNIIANFAGVAAALEIFGIVRWISVLVIGLLIWYTVIRGSYKIVERIFIMVCLVQLAYIASGVLAKPDWGLALSSTFIPSFEFNPNYLFAFIAVVGTTITPWMQFFIQSAVVDKGISIKKYGYERWDVILGSLSLVIVAFFIVIACAATIFKAGITIHSAEEAALALGPLAGNLAKYLFALGLFGASAAGASIISLSTTYAICEAFGFENGLDKHFKEAPVFYGLYTALILLGAGVVLIPNLQLILVMILSQAINGVLLPFILIFMLLLVNNKKLMGKYINSRAYNLIAWSAALILIALTALLLITTLLPG